MSRFVKDREIPLTGMDAGDLHDLVENLVPDDVVDYKTMVVSGGKLAAGWAVPQWRKFTVTHEDLTAAATEQTLTLFTLGTNEIVLAVAWRKVIAFSPLSYYPSYALLYGSVGVTGDTDLYMVLDARNNRAEKDFMTRARFVNTASPAANNVVVLFKTQSSLGNPPLLNTITNGIVDLCFLCSTLS